MSVLGDAIRAKCMDCSCNSFNEIKFCPVTRCPLYEFRFGKNPYSKQRGNPEALRKARDANKS